MSLGERFLSTREAAELLGVGTTSIKRWADRGELAHVKTPGGHRRFSRREVESFLGGGGAGRDPAPEGTAGVGSVLLGDLTAGASEAALARELERLREARGSWSLAADEVGGALDEVGRRWERGEIGVLDEHAASERLARALAACAAAIEVPDAAPRVLLMTAEGEEHALGLGLAELCFREAGWRPVWAGRRTPIRLACAAAGRGEVDAIGVSASLFSQDAADLEDQARRLGGACREAGALLFLGGRGRWPARPAHGQRARRFTELALRPLRPDENSAD